MKGSERLRLAARVAEDSGFIPNYLDRATTEFLNAYLYKTIECNEKVVAQEFKDGSDIPTLCTKYNLSEPQLFTIIRKNIN